MLSKVFSRLFIFLVFSTSTSLCAQVSGIKGQIFDKQSQETLAGATISIIDTDFKVLSDLDGNFVFENISNGSYKIKIDYISYGTVIIDQVEITDNQISFLKIPMEQLSSGIPKETELLNSKRLIAHTSGISSI